MYQPPWQTTYWVQRIADESYIWLSKWLSEQDPRRFRATVNINASLTEQLVRDGRGQVIENLGIAHERGVIEFTDSAAYHAVLPCLPEAIRRDATLRQIEKNRRINRDHFQHWDPRGFFPPEMAFSPDIAAILRQEGYSWTITEDAVFDAGNNGRCIPYDHLATIEGLPVFFRSGEWSRKFAMQYPDSAPRGEYLGRLPRDEVKRISRELVHRFTNDLSGSLDSWFAQGYAVLAYDWETIGHHHKIYGPQALDDYVDALSRSGIKPATLSQLHDRFPGRRALQQSSSNPLKGSWSTTVDEIRRGEHYPLWDHPCNAVHQQYWRLVSEVAKVIPTEPHTEQQRRALHLFDKALNSCPLWWANPQQGRYEREFVRRGAAMLYEAARLAGQESAEYEQVLRLVA